MRCRLPLLAFLFSPSSSRLPLLAFLFFALTTSTSHAFWDFSAVIPRFAADSEITVYVDENSFSTCDWNSPQHQKAISIAVERAIHRWQTGVGMPVNLTFGGWISRSSPPSCPTYGCPSTQACTNVNPNELILACGGNSTTPAIAFMSAYVPSPCDPSQKWISDRGVITFFRTKNDVPIPWTFGHPLSVLEPDFYTVLLHEMGHSLGLGHPCEAGACGNPNDWERLRRNVMWYHLGESWPWSRTGPHTPEIEAMRSVAWQAQRRYDLNTRLVYTSNGTTWNTYGSPLLNYVGFQTPAMAAGPDLGDLSVAYFSPNANQVRWREGNGYSFAQREQWLDGHTHHQPALAIDGQEILVAWVTQDFDHMPGAGREIRVRYSNNGGTTWYARTDIAANTSSRIDATVTWNGSKQIWQIAWVDAETFQAKLAMSINDGSTWSVGTFVDHSMGGDPILVVDGPDIVCTSANTCQIAYREANSSMNDWMKFRSMHYIIWILLGVQPILATDVNGPVTVSSAYNGGMAARILMQSLSGASIDYHVNTGYGGQDWTTRAWRKGLSQSPAPNPYLWIGPVVQTPFDVLNSSQFFDTTSGTYKVIGYYNVVP